MPQTDVLYNVECMNCGSVWTPQPRTRLWWRAKQRAESGKLDAAGATGEECGCVKSVHKPDAPFRVFGYDDTGTEYDMPFERFTDAVRAFRKANSSGDVVFIKGVSDAVQEKLKWML